MVVFPIDRDYVALFSSLSPLCCVFFVNFSSLCHVLLALHQVFLPYWMMQSLLLVEGARVELRSLARPPAGSFVRFKPHDDTFLDLAAQQVP